MKKIIFPLLIILTACHDNDEVKPTPHPYQLQGVVAGETLSWAAPEFSYGSTLGFYPPQAPELKPAVSHGFYLMRNEMQMSGYDNLHITSRQIDPEAFDSFFVPGEYQIGKDFFIQMDVNRKRYTEKNENAGVLKIHEVEKISDTLKRLWVTIDCQLKVSSNPYRDPIVEADFKNAVLIIELRKYQEEE